jgi:hypothetical protein
VKGHSERIPRYERLGFSKRLLGWARTSYLFRGFLVFSCLLAVAYQVENWRGKRAWEICKQQAERKGMVLDWEKLIPPPVAEELNAFKAPMMTEWFEERDRNELSERMNAEVVFGKPQPGGEALAEITLVPVNAEVLPAELDLSLVYRPPLVSLTSAPRTEIPLILMDGVPLVDAIQNLARQAELNFMFDPQVSFCRFGPKGKNRDQPLVSIRWENVTALQALTEILDNFNLEWIEQPHCPIAQIRWKGANTPKIHVELEARDQLWQTIEKCALSRRGDLTARKLRAVTGDFVLFSDTPGSDLPSSRTPARVLLRSDTVLSAKEVRDLFWVAGSSSFLALHRIRVAASGTNSLQVFAVPPVLCGAADYLARTGQFEKDFDLIRDALKRPMARLDGDYHSIGKMPLPNFMGIRVLAQTLAQRAQAHLLMDHPGDALREIRLIHDLCGLLENKPSGKPVTLVAAMIRVALTGMYAATVAEGFQLDKWREPQLCELQQMLSGVRLAPAVAGAFSLERASLCHTLETISADRIAEILFLPATPPSRWDKLKSQACWFLTFAPRGWVYQNMVTAATIGEPRTEPYDPAANTLDPQQIDRGIDDVLKKLNKFSPYSMLATVVVPNFVRAWQTTAKNQALVDHACIACGLERYRLAHRFYPKKLEILVPDFAENLPRDIMTGDLHRYCLRGSSQFLLYSVGWNRTDEGGDPIDPSKPEVDPARGDWVWPQFSAPTSR